MIAFIERARVVLSASVTWLVLGAALLTMIAETVGEEFGGTPGGEWTVRVLGIAVSVLGVAVTIIRRVTPVVPEERGILPNPED